MKFVHTFIAITLLVAIATSAHAQQSSNWPTINGKPMTEDQACEFAEAHCTAYKEAHPKVKKERLSRKERKHRRKNRANPDSEKSFGDDDDSDSTGIAFNKPVPRYVPKERDDETETALTTPNTETETETATDTSESTPPTPKPEPKPVFTPTPTPTPKIDTVVPRRATTKSSIIIPGDLKKNLKQFNRKKTGTIVFIPGFTLMDKNDQKPLEGLMLTIFTKYPRIKKIVVHADHFEVIGTVTDTEEELQINHDFSSQMRIPTNKG